MMSAAVLVDSKAPEAAQQFVHYIARAEAAAAWNDCGVVAPDLKGKPAMGECYEPLPTVAMPDQFDCGRPTCTIRCPVVASRTCTASAASAVVGGLAAGTYTFTIQALNAYGLGPAATTGSRTPGTCSRPAGSR